MRAQLASCTARRLSQRARSPRSARARASSERRASRARRRGLDARETNAAGEPVADAAFREAGPAGDAALEAVDVDAGSSQGARALACVAPLTARRQVGSA